MWFTFNQKQHCWVLCVHGWILGFIFWEEYWFSVGCSKGGYKTSAFSGSYTRVLVSAVWCRLDRLFPIEIRRNFLSQICVGIFDVIRWTCNVFFGFVNSHLPVYFKQYTKTTFLILSFYSLIIIYSILLEYPIFLEQPANPYPAPLIVLLCADNITFSSIYLKWI